jgi:hypothetical protein
MFASIENADWIHISIIRKLHGKETAGGATSSTLWVPLDWIDGLISTVGCAVRLHRAAVMSRNLQTQLRIFELLPLHIPFFLLRSKPHRRGRRRLRSEPRRLRSEPRASAPVAGPRRPSASVAA